MQWTASDPDGDTLTYNLYFGTSSSPPLYASGLTSTSYTVSVSPGTTYYWKVIAKDTAGNTAESDIWSFSVGELDLSKFRDILLERAKHRKEVVEEMYNTYTSYEWWNSYGSRVVSQWVSVLNNILEDEFTVSENSKEELLSIAVEAGMEHLSQTASDVYALGKTAMYLLVTNMAVSDITEGIFSSLHIYRFLQGTGVSCTVCTQLDTCKCFISKTDVVENFGNVPVDDASEIQNTRLALYNLRNVLNDEIAALERGDYTSYIESLRKEKVYAERLLYTVKTWGAGNADAKGYNELVVWAASTWTPGVLYVELRKSIESLYLTFNNAWTFEYREFLNAGEVPYKLDFANTIYWYPAVNVSVKELSDNIYQITVSLHTPKDYKFSGKIVAEAVKEGILRDEVIGKVYHYLTLNPGESYTFDFEISTDSDFKVRIYAENAIVIDSDYTNKLKQEKDVLGKSVYEKYFQKVLIHSTDFLKSYVESPVHLHAVDEYGRHVGVTDSGEVEIQIPEAIYSGPNSHPEWIIIYNTSLNVTFYTTGTGTGTFNLTVEKSDVEKKDVVRIENVPTTQSTVSYFNVNDRTFKLDSNGDGVVDEVKTPPVASFTYTVEGLTVTFDASASYDPDGTITSYQWNFGDGGSETTSQPVVQHTYSQPGTYTVTLTVTDNDGLTTAVSEQITVTQQSSEVTRTLPTTAEPNSIIEVTLTSTAAAIGMQIEETIPSTFTFIDYTYDGANNVNFQQSGNTLTFTVTDIAADGFTITYHLLTPSTEGTYTFTGTYQVIGSTQSSIGGDTTITVLTGESIPDNVDDALEQLVSKYYPDFDWRTDTPTRQDVLNAVVNAVAQYFSTSDQAARQEILNDVVQLVALYFTL